MTEEDKDEARHREVLEAIEKARQQDSFEHGSIITAGREQNKETRAHMGNEIETVRGNSNYLKTRMDAVVKAIKRFIERHGMKADDLDD